MTSPFYSTTTRSLARELLYYVHRGGFLGQKDGEAPWIAGNDRKATISCLMIVFGHSFKDLLRPFKSFSNDLVSDIFHLWKNSFLLICGCRPCTVNCQVLRGGIFFSLRRKLQEINHSMWGKEGWVRNTSSGYGGFE